MSLETELRVALTEHASTVESSETDPYTRVSTAVASSSRRRRTVAAVSLVAVAALAVGVPTLRTRLGDGPGVTVPAARVPLPEAGSPVWRSVGSWPLRGALAGDRSLVGGIEAKTEGRAIFVEDVAATRLAVVVVGDQLAVVPGTRGGGAGVMSSVMSLQLSEAGSDGALSLAGQGALVVLTSPGVMSAEVSGTPVIALDGMVSRSWTRIELSDGVGHARSVPLTQVRVGEFVGRPRLTFGEASRPDEPQPCAGSCTAAELAAFEERQVDREVARALAVDADLVDTRTTYRGEVPTAIADRVVGDVPVGARTTVQVVLSTLPGGQVLRTVRIRTDSPSSSSTFDAESLNPIAAATAERRPVVIAASDTKADRPLDVWVISPGAAAVRAVSLQPSVWPSSDVVPVRDGVARLAVRTSVLTLEEQYSIEVLDARGAVLGSFPTRSGNPELGAR